MMVMRSWEKFTVLFTEVTLTSGYELMELKRLPGSVADISCNFMWLILLTLPTELLFTACFIKSKQTLTDVTSQN